MSDPLRRLIFLGGTGRSGTTLMHKILCKNSSVAGSAEFDHLLPMMRLRQRMRSPGKLLRQSPYYGEAELDAAWREFVYRLVAAKAGDRDCVAEKTPSNIAVIEDLLELFPEARFIAMVRDGRDVVASHLDIRDGMRKRHPKIEDRWLREFGIVEVCRTWKRNLRDIERAQSSAGSDRLMLIRYEKLVNDPVACIKDVCLFLKLDYQEEMLMPETLDAEQTGHRINIDGIWYSESSFSKPISASSVGRWKERLNPSQKIVSAILIGKDLHAYGYELSALERIFSGLRNSLRKWSGRLRFVWLV